MFMNKNHSICPNSLRVLFSALITIALTLSPNKLCSAINIIYSGNIQGRLEPCGCPGGEKVGGLSKRAKKIRDIKKSGKQVVIVDAGNSLYDTKQREMLSDCQFELKTKKFIEIFTSIGLDAINLGADDLKFGQQVLLQYIKNYNLPVISSNIIVPDTQVIKPYRIIAVGNEKLGVVGLCRLEDAEITKGYECKSYDEAILENIGTLQSSGCNYIVLLSDLNDDELDKLLRKYPEINLVINSNPKLGLSDMRKTIAGKEVLASREKGKGMGLAVNDKFQDYFEFGKLSPYDPQVDETIRDYKEKLTDMCNEVDPTNQTYISSLACLPCHQQEYKKWELTSHASAYEILYKTHDENNPVCIGCHTTGYRKEGGYSSNIKIGNLINVQCEECHGFGKWHAWQDGEPKYIKKEVNESACKQCHNLERSPDFIFKDYSNMILCSVSHRLDANVEFDFNEHVVTIGFECKKSAFANKLKFNINPETKLQLLKNNSSLEFSNKEFSLPTISKVQDGIYADVPTLYLNFKKGDKEYSKENIRFKLAYAYSINGKVKNSSYSFTVKVPEMTVPLTVDTNTTADIRIFGANEATGTLVSNNGQYKGIAKTGNLVHISNDELSIDDYFVLTNKELQEGLTYSENQFSIQKEYKGELVIQATSGGHNSGWIRCQECNEENKIRPIPAMYSLPVGYYNLNLSKDKDGRIPIGQAKVKIRNGKKEIYSVQHPLPLD